MGWDLNGTVTTSIYLCHPGKKSEYLRLQNTKGMFHTNHIVVLHFKLYLLKFNCFCRHINVGYLRRLKNVHKYWKGNNTSSKCYYPSNSFDIMDCQNVIFSNLYKHIYIYFKTLQGIVKIIIG